MVHDFARQLQLLITTIIGALAGLGGNSHHSRRLAINHLRRSVLQQDDTAATTNNHSCSHGVDTATDGLCKPPKSGPVHTANCAWQPQSKILRGHQRWQSWTPAANPPSLLHHTLAVASAAPGVDVAKQDGLNPLVVALKDKQQKVPGIADTIAVRPQHVGSARAEPALANHALLILVK